MHNRETIVRNKAGIHARPAAMIAETAQRFSAEVMLTRDGTVVNAKSIIDIMLLAAEKGSKINIAATGADEEKAAQAIYDLFERKFDED
ncbi:MAG: HPr family phosphocarrier protein [Candidatus Wallbacteria bacterium]|nr:HPr family phosphocarrier protein [Candidatus Wallbacteria bacterium]